MFGYLVLAVVCVFVSGGLFILTALAQGMSDSPEAPAWPQWPALIPLFFAAAFLAEWWWRW